MNCCLPFQPLDWIPVILQSVRFPLTTPVPVHPAMFVGRFESGGRCTCMVPPVAASPTSKKPKTRVLPAAAGMTRTRLKTELAPVALA